MRIFTIAATLIALAFAGSAFAAPVIGEAAPHFTATTATGESLNLADLKGKQVVLEWTNKGCPFVKKFYEPGEMQRLQKEATEDGVVWISIVSSAEGKQGYVDAEAALANAEKVGANPSHIVLDPTGEIGKLYSAKTTPHMFVIDAEGTLAYAGAIDSIPSAREDDIAKATNYVTAALASLKAGTAIEVASTQPYGCSVKYNYF